MPRIIDHPTLGSWRPEGKWCLERVRLRVWALVRVISVVKDKKKLSNERAGDTNLACSSIRSLLSHLCFNLTRWSRVFRDTAASQLNDISRFVGAFGITIPLRSGRAALHPT